jgi:hypothetical protein
MATIVAFLDAKPLTEEGDGNKLPLFFSSFQI